MSEPRRIAWPRLAAEGATIVVSILLAFAVDAWWGDVLAGRHERRILAGLRTDFTATRLQAAEVRASHERIIDSARHLLTLTGPRPLQVQSSRVDSLVAGLLPGSVFVPVQGTLAALLNSDGLGSISNMELQAELSEWPRHVASVQRAETEAQRLMNGDIMPYLHGRVPVRSLDKISSPEIGGSWSRFPLESSRMLTDLRFENLVNDRLFYAVQAAGALQQAEAAAARILELIDLPLATDSTTM